MKASNIAMKYNFSSNSIYITADETRIKQVIFNLISNAVKYSPKGGTVVICVQMADADNVILSVEDSGVGIAPESQGLVFEKFYRTGAISGQQSGSGLGLSIVKSMVELHKGKVNLLSNPNEGTQVSCFLPVSTLTTDTDH
jgi:signal transduction histidine kinase